MRFVSRFSMVSCNPMRWLASLMAVGALMLAGCGSDDDVCTITNARISQANSVFTIFANQGNDCFLFEGGLFGPNGMGSASPTQLCFSEIQADAVPPAGRFMTVPDDQNEPSAEGGVDGAASCNYDYDNDPNRIECPLCDILVNARNIDAGGEGPGEMELHLAGARTPETLADPPLRSATVAVTVGTNAQCDVTSINGVAVTQDAMN